MATIVKTSSGTWKALIRKTGWPATAKTFRTKRDAEDWARRTEDEMVRGVYIQRAPAERMTVEAALTRYWICPCITGHHFTFRLVRRQDAGTLSVNGILGRCAEGFRCNVRRPAAGYMPQYSHRASA
jgi:hypothetical protein